MSENKGPFGFTVGGAIRPSRSYSAPYRFAAGAPLTVRCRLTELTGLTKLTGEKWRSAHTLAAFVCQERYVNAHTLILANNVNTGISV